MSIFNYINNKKNEFKNRRADIEIGKIDRENRDLELDRDRELRIAEANKKRSSLRAEVQPLKQSNDSMRGESIIQKMGRGMANATNAQPKSSFFSNDKLTDSNIKNKSQDGFNFSSYKGALGNSKIRGIKFK